MAKEGQTNTIVKEGQTNTIVKEGQTMKEEWEVQSPTTCV
jgi:hypothetical protein